MPTYEVMQENCSSCPASPCKPAPMILPDSQSSEFGHPYIKHNHISVVQCSLSNEAGTMATHCETSNMKDTAVTDNGSTFNATVLETSTGLTRQCKHSI